jgi:hypothetical protein
MTRVVSFWRMSPTILDYIDALGFPFAKSAAVIGLLVGFVALMTALEAALRKNSAPSAAP